MSESEGEDFYEGNNYYAIYEEDDELNKEVLESIESKTPSKSIESKTNDT